jgi:hypothetical protein
MHRFDLIGAADLGQDPAIGADGLCFGIAIRPCNRLFIERSPAKV